MLLAATATLGLGLVLGPEAPLIALGMGLGILSMRLLKKDAPQQALGLMAAAGSFAAVSTIFGSPVIGAVLIIEATGLGGAVLPLVLLPGLLAAGIGSLVFIGLGSWTGFSTSAWQLSPFALPPFDGPGWGDFGWTILLASRPRSSPSRSWSSPAGASASSRRRRSRSPSPPGSWSALLAIAFAQTTDQSENAVLFSGQEAFGSLFASAATLSVSTLVLLFLFKGLAWSISLGSFRGGPTFPAIFLGVVAGPDRRAPAGLRRDAGRRRRSSGAMCVSILRLPLSSVMIALLLTVDAGLAVAPLVIVAVVVAYLTSLALTAYVDARVGGIGAERAGRRAALPHSV